MALVSLWLALSSLVLALVMVIHRPSFNDVMVVVFRGVRELMINIAKHARTKRAAVSVSREGQNIKVVVEDRGTGFKQNKKTNHAFTKGYGLFSIRERVEFFGGSLDVTSTPRHGTRVTLTAPLTLEKPE